MTPLLAPRICRDRRPWVKECRDCGHMKQLTEFPLQGNPRAHSFGGSHSVCSACRGEQLGMAVRRVREVA